MHLLYCKSRRSGSSHSPQMFFKIGVLKSFANFTGKQLCWSFSIKATFLWILQNFWEHFFYSTLWMTASVDDSNSLMHNFPRWSDALWKSCSIGCSCKIFKVYLTISGIYTQIGKNIAFLVTLNLYQVTGILHVVYGINWCYKKGGFSIKKAFLHKWLKVWHCWIEHLSWPAGNYLLKVNKRSTRTRYEICSKLTIKIPEHISNLDLVFLLLTLNM